MLLRSGLAHLEESLGLKNNAPQNAETKLTQFIIPLPQSELHQYVEVKLTEQESTHQKESTSSSQKITLDFSSEALGSLVCQLEFPRGFQSPECHAVISLERSGYLPLFQKYTGQFQNNLQRAGLEVTRINLEEKTTTSDKGQPSLMFQIDDYV